LANEFLDHSLIMLRLFFQLVELVAGHFGTPPTRKPRTIGLGQRAVVTDFGRHPNFSGKILNALELVVLRGVSVLPKNENVFDQEVDRQTNHPSRTENN
jgi:hypothetical protein